MAVKPLVTALVYQPLVPVGPADGPASAIVGATVSRLTVSGGAGVVRPAWLVQ